MSAERWDTVRMALNMWRDEDVGYPPGYPEAVSALDALRAEHAEMAAAIDRFVTAFDQRFKPTGIEDEYAALRAARIQGEA